VEEEVEVVEVVKEVEEELEPFTRD